ncbi:Hypothetical predicted protein [Paramuricea clavata]|uniref:QRICH1-like domain-containing protein n=1 Tax=Paramuricea clavata TaxID=317549 RepID=A0A6S7FMM0_PARCT|nr:Hypothetical predicted protein [Paramuricea clavata]
MDLDLGFIISRKTASTSAGTKLVLFITLGVLRQLTAAVFPALMDVNWIKKDGHLTQIDNGLTTDVWGVSNNYIYRLSKNSTWEQVEGSMKHVSTGEAGIWGVNSLNDVHIRKGVTSTTPSGTEWKKILPEKFKQIDSGPRGIVYAVNQPDFIFCRRGITTDIPEGTAWIRLDGLLKYVSCNVMGCYGVNWHNDVYYRTGVTEEDCKETENLDFSNSESTSANTSHAESTNARNISLISDEELQKMKKTRIPLNTKRNTAWAVRVWKEWAEERNSKTPANKKVGLDICKVSDVELRHWLAKFVVEVRKKATKGECYPPNTLYQLCCALLRYLRNNGRPALNFFEDPNFKHF